MGGDTASCRAASALTKREQQMLESLLCSLKERTDQALPAGEAQGASIDALLQLHASENKERKKVRQVGKAEAPLAGKKETSSPAFSLLRTVLKRLSETETAFSEAFYSRTAALYQTTFLPLAKKQPAVTYAFASYRLSQKATDEYFSALQAEKGFVYKRPKGGDAMLDLVAFNEVTNIDYAEIIEITRAAKMNITAKSNYVDPEAEERFKSWRLFLFNQVMSFFYYDFAV